MPKLSRRSFIKYCSLAAAGMCVGGSLFEPAQAAKKTSSTISLKEADYYKSLPNGDVQCELCPCSPSMKIPGRLSDGQTCVCHVRVNKNGKLYVTNYGKAAILRAEALEKNPLYHFLPGTIAMAVSSPGCSLACKGCQNWQISQFDTKDVETVNASPSKVVSMASEDKCKAIAYTYTEPMMFYEYLYDIAALAKEKGIKNAVVSGGYVNPAPVKELCKVVDAFSISVKAFSDKEYFDYAHGKLSTIKKAMETVKNSNRWLEIVVLVIPSVSDDLTKMRGFIKWVKSNLGSEVPIHFDRFWPSYKLNNVAQTPQKTLERAREIAVSEGIKYAYVGNLPGHWGANTYCPKCKQVLIRRVAFKVIENNLKSGKCGKCGTKVPGIFS